MNKSILIACGIIVILLGVGAFFAVQSGQQNKSVDAIQELPQSNITGVPTGVPTAVPTSVPTVVQDQPQNLKQSPPLPSGAQMPGVPNGSQPFFGTISNFDTSSFTIQSPKGENKILITSKTEFKDGSLSDLKNDIRIAGYGTKNDDNTITALQIQINPSMPDKGQLPSR
jgi:hypothetical protein